MKSICICFILFNLLLLPARHAQAARPQSDDPIVGHWNWGPSLAVDLSGDGDAHYALPNYQMDGHWKFASEEDGKRCYVINWDHGKWIDTVFLSDDHNSITGHNQVAWQISATRMAEKKSSVKASSAALAVTAPPIVPTASPRETTAIPAAPQGEFPETASRLLTAADIKDWDDARLQRAINEMYARYGADFKDAALKKEYQRFDWYHPEPDRTYDMAEASFSEIEKRNVRMLGEWRKNAGKSGDASAAARPWSATVVDSPPDQQYGNIQVHYADGHSEVWTKGGLCSDPHVSGKGIVGWVFGDRAVGAQGRRIGTDVLRVQRPGGTPQEFQPNENGRFIEEWAFVDADANLVIKCRGHHGAATFIKYDLATGRVLDHVDGYRPLKELPNWARPFSDDI